MARSSGRRVSSGSPAAVVDSTRSPCWSGSATRPKARLEELLAAPSVGPLITTSPSIRSTFHGGLIVAARTSFSRAREMFDRAVVDQEVHSERHAAGDLVERAVEVVIGHADRVEASVPSPTWAASRRWPSRLSSVRRVPGRTVSTASGKGSAAAMSRPSGSPRRSGTSASRSSAVIPSRVALVGQLDPIALARDLLKQPPVVVQRRVDVQGDSHRPLGTVPHAEVDPPLDALPAAPGRGVRGPGRRQERGAEPEG